MRLKVLAFHPSKPVSAAGETTPVNTGPKVTTKVDDLKVTPLDEAAAAVLPNLALTADGAAFYTLDPAGNVRRLDWEGKQLAAAPARGMNQMAVSSRGLVMASPADAKLVDANALTLKSSGPLENTRGLTSAPALDFAIARCEGTIASLPVIDLGGFTFATLYVEKRPPGAKAGTFSVLSGILGKSDPVLSSDGRWLYLKGGGQLHRWSVASYKVSPLSRPRLSAAAKARSWSAPTASSWP